MIAINSTVYFLTWLTMEVIRCFRKGEFRLDALAMPLIMSILLILINIMYVNKHGSVTFYDERTKSNLLKYVTYASQIIFLILIVVLSFLTASGIESISINYLWMFVLAYMLVIGLGGFIASKY